MESFKALDFLGTNPTLFIQGKKSFKTRLGGVISIIFGICIIASSSYFLNLLVSRSLYTIETSEEYDTNSFASWNDMEISMNLLDKVGLALPEPDRLFGVTSMWSYYDEVRKPDNTTQFQMKMYPMKLEKCNVTKHFSDPVLIPQVESVNSFYCVVPNQNFNMSRPFGYPKYAAIWFWVHRCKNTTLKNDCHPPEKIERDLMNTNVGLTFKNYYFDHKRSEKIGQPYLFSDALVASSTNYRRVRYILNKVSYTIDNGLIFSSVNKENYLTLNDFRETIDFRTDPVIPGALVGISFNMHVLKQNIRKNYYKFQNMLADFGGLYRAALVIISFFNSYFSDIIYFNEIIEKNLSSMSTKNNSSSNLSQKNEIKNDFSNINMINLGPSQNKFLNLNNYQSKYKTFRNRSKFNINYEEVKNIEQNKSNLSLFNLKTESKKVKSEKSDGKINIVRFELSEILTPLWCHNKNSASKKNLELHQKFQSFIIKQLDIINVVAKLNNLDKISMILSDREMTSILENCVNPLYYEESNSYVNSEFNQLKHHLINNLNNMIFNSISTGENNIE